MDSLRNRNLPNWKAIQSGKSTLQGHREEEILQARPAHSQLIDGDVLLLILGVEPVPKRRGKLPLRRTARADGHRLRGVCASVA